MVRPLLPFTVLGPLLLSRIQANSDPATQVQPTIGTTEQLPGTYAVVMVDLDIPADLQNGDAQNGTETPAQNGTDSQNQPNTLLHWLQTGLTSSSEAMDINGTQVFLLQNADEEEPLSEYTGPSPPALEPLSHRYTFVLVDHSDIQPEGLDTLMTSSQERLGFDAEAVLAEAGLQENVVAGNFFNVTNGEGTANGTVNGTSVDDDGSSTEEGGPAETDLATAGAGMRVVGGWTVLAGIVVGAVWGL